GSGWILAAPVLSVGRCGESGGGLLEYRGESSAAAGEDGQVGWDQAAGLAAAVRLGGEEGVERGAGAERGGGRRSSVGPGAGVAEEGEDGALQPDPGASGVSGSGGERGPWRDSSGIRGDPAVGRQCVAGGSASSFRAGVGASGARGGADPGVGDAAVRAGGAGRRSGRGPGRSVVAAAGHRDQQRVVVRDGV